MKAYEIPENCPPALAKLIKFFGSPHALGKAIGQTSGQFYKAADGRSAFTPRMAALVAKAQAKVDAGKIKQPPMGRQSKLKLPPLLAQLVEKEGSIVGAAQALGASTSWLRGFDGAKTLSDLHQARVQKAIDGGATSLIEDGPMGADKFRLGIAIVFSKATSFEHLYNLAEALSGVCLFKKSTSAGWLAIFKMKREKLTVFKIAGERDGTIVCP